MTETGWLAAHLFHQGDLDHVLTELVTPLVAELDRPAFFLRYWEGGNHVRLRVRTTDEAAREIIRTRAEAYFAEHPSPDLMAPENYRRLAVNLAQGENMTEFAELQPNNTVRFLSYVREHHRYGRGRAMEAVEQHFAESSAIALRLLSRELTPEQRDTACYSLMLLAWFAAVPDLALLAKHRDPLHAWWGQRFAHLGAVTDEEMAQRWARRREPLVALAGRLRADDGPFAAWTDSVRRLAATLCEPGSGAPADGVLPVLDSCAHLFCNRIGISPPGEVYLRFLAVNAVEELAR